MPFQIRHKATGDIIKMRSGKSVWAKEAHAKSAWLTSGLTPEDRKKYEYSPSGSRWGHGREYWAFNNQGDFELVEVADQSSMSVSLRKAIELLEESLDDIADYCGNDSLIERIEQFLKENK